MQLIELALPVLIESGSEEWPYAVRGTYFVLELDDNKYVVTARHVVEGNSATSVFFRYRSESRSSLPLDQEIFAKEYIGPKSPEYTDVILYRIAQNYVNELFNAARLDISTQPWRRLQKGDSLIFRGYPSKLQAASADGLKEQGVVLDAKYIGPAQHPGCHEIRLFRRSYSPIMMALAVLLYSLPKGDQLIW